MFVLLMMTQALSHLFKEDRVVLPLSTHMHSTPVPVFGLLTMALSHPFKEDSLALPLSTPLSSRSLMVSFQ